MLHASQRKVVPPAVNPVMASRQQPAMNVAVHVGEPEVAAGVAVGEAFVVQAEEMEYGGVEVVNADGVFDGVVAKVIGGPVHRARLHAAAGEPEGETLGVMTSAVLVLHFWCATKLSAPDDQGVFQ